VPDTCWAWPLPWLVPPRVAMQLLLTGDPIDASRAREVGLVNEVVPLAELRATVQALAERIARYVAGTGDGRHPSADLDQLAAESERRVIAYTRLEPAAQRLHGDGDASAER